MIALVVKPDDQIKVRETREVDGWSFPGELRSPAQLLQAIQAIDISQANVPEPNSFRGGYAGEKVEVRSMKSESGEPENTAIPAVKNLINAVIYAVGFSFPEASGVREIVR